MKNQLNSLIALLGSVTCVFISNSAFAQTTNQNPTTNVPFTGGTFNVIVSPDGKKVITNSARGLTPLGTVDFTFDANSTFRNNSRSTSTKSIQIGTNLDKKGDSVAAFGTSSGRFDFVGNTGFFNFPKSDTTVLGEISSITDSSLGRTIESIINSGVINLPNSSLGIAETSGFPTTGGNFSILSRNAAFDKLAVRINSLLSSIGTVEITIGSTFLSTLNAPSLGYIIEPGKFSPFKEPKNLNGVVNQGITLSGITSGKLDLQFTVFGFPTSTIVPFNNSVYRFEGKLVLINPLTNEINLNITGGTINFLTAVIKQAEEEATKRVEEVFRQQVAQRPTNVNTGGGVVISTPAVTPAVTPGEVKISTPPPSAIASSSVHSDVTNQSTINVLSANLNAETGSLLGQNRITEGYQSIESSRSSLLSSYTGASVPSRIFSIDQSLNEIARVSKISKSETAVVYPVVLKDRLEILLLSNGNAFRTSVALPQEALTEIVLRFRDNLQDTSSSAYLVESKLLYNLLVRPIEAELQSGQIKTIVFALDGDFRSVPVAALNDGKQFLIEKYALATVPSLSLANTGSTTSVLKRKNNILAVGLTESVQGFSALPNVKTEISAIGSKILGGTSLFNQDFTVENIQAQRIKENFNIIHLATHAEFEEEISDSFVLFWDKKVRSGQIPKLRLGNIDLLTLSACQTAVGNNLGLSGLAVASGVKSVLASLWSVDDAGTTPLMIDFYSNYNDAPSKAIALQEAQISLLNGTVKIVDKTIKGIPGIGDIPLAGVGDNIDLKHPYYWSSFILVGNWL